MEDLRNQHDAPYRKVPKALNANSIGISKGGPMWNTLHEASLSHTGDRWLDPAKHLAARMDEAVARNISRFEIGRAALNSIITDLRNR